MSTTTTDSEFATLVTSTTVVQFGDIVMWLDGKKPRRDTAKSLLKEAAASLMRGDEYGWPHDEDLADRIKTYLLKHK